jgi:hypothetical protein
MTKLRAVTASTYDGYSQTVYYLPTYISIYVPVIGRITWKAAPRYCLCVSLYAFA